MKKIDIARQLAERAQMKPKKALACVDIVLDAISSSLELSEDVTLRGFGTFSVRLAKARKGRDFSGGGSVAIPEYRIAKFRMGKGLRKALNR